MQNLTFEARLLAASRMARNAHVQFSLWSGLSSVDAHKAHRTVLNTYWEHLRFTKQAHLVAALVELHSLYKKHKRTINMPDLLLDMRRSGLDVSKPQRMLDKVSDKIEKVEILRNNALAHRTKSKEYNDVFISADITPTEIRHLIDVGVESVSLALLIIGKHVPIISEEPANSLDEMLTHLGRA